MNGLTVPQAPTSHLGVSCCECMCLNSGPFVQADFVQVSTALRSGGWTHAPAATRIVRFAFSSCTHSNFRARVPVPQLAEHSPHGSALHLKPGAICSQTRGCPSISDRIAGQRELCTYLAGHGLSLQRNGGGCCGFPTLRQRLSITIIWLASRTHLKIAVWIPVNGRKSSTGV